MAWSVWDVVRPSNWQSTEITFVSELVASTLSYLLTAVQFSLVEVFLPHNKLHKGRSFKNRFVYYSISSIKDCAA